MVPCRNRSGGRTQNRHFALLAPLDAVALHPQNLYRGFVRHPAFRTAGRSWGVAKR